MVLSRHAATAQRRVTQALTRLQGQVLLDARPLQVLASPLKGEPVPFAEATARPFEPVPQGFRWGAAWDTCWFRLTGEVPAEWKGRQVVVKLDLGWRDGMAGFSVEGLLYTPDGTPVRGICFQHDEHQVTGAVDLYLEAAANPVVYGSIPPYPADPEGPPLGELKRAELVLVDTEARAVALDLAVLLELASCLPDKDVRARKLWVVLSETAGLLEADRPLAEVRAVLAKGYEPKSSPTAHVVHAVGNAHIDSAWLWPVRETKRKCARSFSTAVELMDRYPDYRFACSQPQQLAWVRDEQPALFERIKKHVAGGQFEVVGAMWVEPDMNLPSGESLVRQLVHGLRFCEDELGVSPKGLWLPDVFGYSANLPQLLVKAGLDWFTTQKLSWNDTNEFPHHTFLWEGIDGTRVFTHFPPADTYEGDVTVSQLRHASDNFADHETAERSLYLFGFGDGGGGPTDQMLERCQRVQDLEGLPKVELTTAQEFFDVALAETGKAPVWVGELYFEKHRGTYTSQARTKVGNRRAEQALRAAELWSSLVGLAPDLDEAWKLLLLQQFHDILPGSSIEWVHDDAERDLASVIATARAAMDKALDQLAESVDTPGLLVLNSAPDDRAGVVVADQGEQPLQDGAFATWASAPAHGWAIASGQPAAPVTVDGQTMSNGLLSVSWDDQGLLTSVRHLATDREVLTGPGALLQVHPDRPGSWDAWDVDSYYRDHVEDLTAALDVQVLDAGPLRASVRVRREHGSSTYETTYVLDAGSPRLDVVVDVDWQEEHRFLKIAFPVDVRSPRASYEVQYGHVERPTHLNTSWDAAKFEVCGHKWADLSEAGFGVALLNDGRYGYDILGSTMRLSLLRASTWPAPRADRGRHTTTLSLLPHAGDLVEGEVVAQGYQLNLPWETRTATGGGPRPATGSVVASSNPRVVVDAVKPAEDGDGTVVRCYEAGGGRARTTLALAGRTWQPCDLLERPTGPETPVGQGIALELGAFEVVTVRVR